MNNNIKYELDLDKFMENVTTINKSFSYYLDDNGTHFYMNTVNLMVRVDYIELSTEKVGENGASEYEKALFNKIVTKQDYKKKEIKKPVPKSEITGKKEDMYTITDKKEKVVQIWKVSNTLGAYKCFTDKDKALTSADFINSEILSYLEE